MTTLLFIHDVVEGHNVARGFGIVTPGLRGYSTTCTGWVAGTKVKRFHNVDWNRSSYKLSVAATEQRIYLVKLFSTVHGVAPRTFEIELRQPPGGGPWSVDAWLDS